jgi:TonB-dependent receptor
MPRRLLLTLAALLLTSAMARAGTIRGTVTDTQGKPLPYATVRIDGTEMGTQADRNGAFTLTGVPDGAQTVRITYVGYAALTEEVAVSATDARIEAQLRESAITLDETVTYGEATRGQATALQRQRTAPNITNVVSEELFNRFPDRNAAETIRRLPGISMDRDQGEGEFVQIRGIDQAYNSLTIGGVRIPAPDEGGGTRSVGLDLINNNLLSEVEVVKAITPDMDADAIGGVVNFSLREAPAGGVRTIGVGVGLNDQTSDFDTYGKTIQDVNVVVGERFHDGQLGLVVDGAYYATSRHSKLREFEYDDGDGALDEIIFAQHTNDYDIKRQRMGVSASTDYRTGVTGKLFASASYNVYLDDEVRRVVDYNINNNEEERETRNRLEDQRVGLFMLGGEQDLGFGRLSGRAAWIQASEELPDRTYLRYGRDLDLSGFTNEQIKAFDGTSTFPGAEPSTLNRIRYDDMRKEDTDLSGQLDLAIPFQAMARTHEVKVGFKVLSKNVSYERVRFQMTSFARTETLAEGTFGFEDVRYDDSKLSPVLTDWGNPRNITDDYEGSETVTAAYGMVTVHLTDRLSALVGGRFEDTSNDYTQPNPETQDTPLTGEGGYNNFMPSAHLTFRPDDSNVVRAAFTTGIARPSYESLIPRRVVDEDDRTIRYGNPDLEPRTAWNLDLMYERYTSNLGVLGAGLYYKSFDAFHTTRVFDEEINGEVYTASQTIMGDGTATYAGIELSAQQRLAGFSSMLSDVSLFANYNYTWSEGDVGGRTVELTNSPEHIANLSLIYDNADMGLSFVVAANYRDALLIGVTGDERTDVYFEDEFHLEFSAAKKLTRQLTLSTQVSGLTAQREREVLGDPSESFSRVLQWEEYGPTGTINLQYSFE